MHRNRFQRELSFLLSLWKANILSAMEYRAAFISQAIGMMLNNAIYFLFWVIFFGRFKEVRGWGLQEMFLLFGVVAAGVGLSNFLFGNALTLSEVIVSGRLDYYLTMPRPVLLHVLASKSVSSGVGDFSYGLLSFLFAGAFSLDALLRFVLSVTLAMIIFLSFLILVQSLSFWIGSAQLLSSQALNAMITFSIYPLTLFEGSARLVMFTIVPAALIGAVPAEFIRQFNWLDLGAMLGGALVFLSLAVWTFQRGLRHYESGSAFQIQV